MSLSVTAFAGNRLIASGLLADVASAAKAVLDEGEAEPILIFSDLTGAIIEVDFRGTPDEVRSRITLQGQPATVRAGRPKLGVVAREVTLLPQHWDWLSQQQGGASATLRRMVDQARRGAPTENRAARDGLYRFITTMAGDAPGYEEATRALFAGDAARFAEMTAQWPLDIRDHALRLTPGAFGITLSPLDTVIPPARREPVKRALQTAFSAGDVTAATPLTGGLSLGGLYKLTIAGTDYVMRLDEASKGFRDPARQYACLNIASEAGVAPHVYYADANERIVITDFIPTPSWKIPENVYLTRVAQAVRTLHAAPLFPRLMPYFHAIEILIGMLKATNIVPLDALSEHFRLYRELVAVYPKGNSELVSSHNDLNPNNVLFRGEQPFFVDWETAFAADRYVDLATLGSFASTEAGEELILQTYFGDDLDAYKRARFYLMLQVSRLFYGIALLNIAAYSRPDTRVLPETIRDAPSFRAIRHEMHLLTTLQGQIRFGCASFQDALKGMQHPRCKEAMAIVTART